MTRSSESDASEEEQATAVSTRVIFEMSRMVMNLQNSQSAL